MINVPFSDLNITPPSVDNKVVEGAVQGTAVFGFIQTIFVFIGIAIVIFTLFKVVKAFAKGSFGDALKTGVGGIIAAALCFNLWMPINLVKSMSGIVGNVFTTVGQTAKQTGGTAPTPAPAPTNTPPAS